MHSTCVQAAFDAGALRSVCSAIARGHASHAGHSPQALGRPNNRLPSPAPARKGRSVHTQQASSQLSLGGLMHVPPAAARGSWACRAKPHRLHCLQKELVACFARVLVPCKARPLLGLGQEEAEAHRVQRELAACVARARMPCRAGPLLGLWAGHQGGRALRPCILRGVEAESDLSPAYKL